MHFKILVLHIYKHKLTGKLKFGFSAHYCSKRICGKTLVTSCIPISVGVNNYEVSSIQFVTMVQTCINITTIQLPSEKKMSRLFLFLPGLCLNKWLYAEKSTSNIRRPESRHQKVETRGFSQALNQHNYLVRTHLKNNKDNKYIFLRGKE